MLSACSLSEHKCDFYQRSCTELNLTKPPGMLTHTHTHSHTHTHTHTHTKQCNSFKEQKKKKKLPLGIVESLYFHQQHQLCLIITALFDALNLTTMHWSDMHHLSQKAPTELNSQKKAYSVTACDTNHNCIHSK